MKAEDVRIGMKVRDTFRSYLYGDTVGTISMSMGPFRVLVLWPDIRGEQLEKLADLETV